MDKLQQQQPQLNLEFVQTSELTIKAVIIGFIVLGVLLNIIACMYRKYAKYIIYYELLMALAQGFIPLNYGDVANITFFFFIIYNFLLYSCNMGPNIVASVIALPILIIFENPFVFSVEITLNKLMAKVFTCLFCFVSCTLLGMVLTYIAQINGKIIKLVAENQNLLDRMHEGLIVISQKDKSLKFASKPAVALLK